MSDHTSAAEELFARLSAMEAKELRLAASVLILRDASHGLEVLMVVRNKAIEFASGAMVFPGGRLMAADYADAMGDRLTGGDGLATDEAALRVAALREAFEEVGMLPTATIKGVAALDSDIAPIDDQRAAVDKGTADFATVLREADLSLAVDQLALLAHIIAPKITPKRFNTHFYATIAPPGQSPRPDGQEIMEAFWIRPQDALALAERRERTVMFPTRIVLTRLAQFTCAADALSAARKDKPEAVEPMLEMRDGSVGLTTRAVPGFPATWEELDLQTRGRKNLAIPTTETPAG